MKSWQVGIVVLGSALAGIAGGIMLVGSIRQWMAKD